MVLTLLVTGICWFTLVPVARPYPYQCNGGMICVRQVSLSCLVFGFGASDDFMNQYFIGACLH